MCVCVFTDDPDAEGLAMTYFKVNKSPRKGACSVLPTSGVEMDTLFNVFCKEWQDEVSPLLVALSLYQPSGHPLVWDFIFMCGSFCLISLSVSLSNSSLMIITMIITYIYKALNDALSASRIHNKLKTILSKYIHIQNRQS